MKLQEFEKLKNTDRLSKIIYLNFIKLMNQPGIDFSIESIENLLVSNNMVGWFLLDNNDKIVGYLIGEKKSLQDGRIVFFMNYFYIHKTYRGYGLGKKMLLKCLNYVKSNNILFTMLITEKDTVGYKLYKKIGFKKDAIIKINNPNYVVLSNYSI